MSAPGSDLVVSFDGPAELQGPLKGARYGMVRLDALIPNKRNPNTMSPEAYAALKESIRVNGFTQPLLTCVLALIDGHHRTRALIELGYTHAPAIILPLGTPQETITILMIGMNKLRGHVSIDVAEVLLRELLEEGADPVALIATGFSESELSAIIDGGPEEPEPRNNAPADDAVLPERPHILELRFESAAELKKVRRLLKKASGAVKDESTGLLHLLGETKN